MQCTIKTFQLTDGTLSGGVALENLQITFDRIHDIVIPLGIVRPVLFDRGIRKTTIDFIVTRVHASIKAAEQYLLVHDASFAGLPATVTLASQDGSTSVVILNARVFSQLLNKEIGATTVHAYHIEGGPFSTATEAFIIAETGEHILTEDGQKIKTE